MTLESILMMLGGIGLFLYGMKLMGNSLERCAGARMEQILERLTNNKAKGVALGAGVTAVIQSSSATIIMVIGFLNAGIMNLIQAVPVIMGANIGTTVTAQILRLGDISSDNVLLTMLKPASFAPICIVIGAFVLLLAKKQKIKDRAGIVIGLGILFCGMSMMESAFAPLTESEEFRNIFTVFENPVLGVLTGAAVTILLQSSSASVGVLQATASTGVITFAMAAPMVIGANIGKCATVLLASIGTNKNAKRAVCTDITMCCCGAILFLGGIYLYQWIIGFGIWDNTMSRGNIADFHTLFNLATCLVMLPLCNVLIAFSKKIVKDKGSSKMDEELALLDERFLNTPNVALQQCKKVITSMGETARENFSLAYELLEKFDDNKLEQLKENEKFLDKTETVLGEYILKITEKSLSEESNKLANEMMRTVTDWERIGDHCVNLAELAEIKTDSKLKFSIEGFSELKHINAAIDNILELTIESYGSDDEDMAFKVAPMEDVIDDLVDLLKDNHIERLRKGECTVERGVSFVEMLTNIERISDHCDNISLHMRQRMSGAELDTHVKLKKEYEFKRLYHQYSKLYYEPVLKHNINEYKHKETMNTEQRK